MVPDAGALFAAGGGALGSTAVDPAAGGAVGTAVPDPAAAFGVGANSVLVTVDVTAVDGDPVAYK